MSITNPGDKEQKYNVAQGCYNSLFRLGRIKNKRYKFIKSNVCERQRYTRLRQCHAQGSCDWVKENQYYKSKLLLIYYYLVIYLLNKYEIHLFITLLRLINKKNIDSFYT